MQSPTLLSWRHVTLCKMLIWAKEFTVRKKTAYLAQSGTIGKKLHTWHCLGMYAKCGALEKAQKVLEELTVWSSVSWNALIARYAQQEQGKKSLGYESPMHAS
ncbi:hypothetical protein GOP47_0009949 [Adiantum capillus-veneris]|uniref:Uncharacterized protein n=1 Tax=Adiantum capillus-veneris TaxID=13818 RepID=A0A9D4UYE8_ADICA|nr:hypothetical protein GOP47_0009949 [Adiantum capillus-veneris]